MSFNWINTEEYSFQCLLLLERFQIRLICTRDSQEWVRSLSIALSHNPAVKWYFLHRCPECASYVEEITAGCPAGLNPMEVRRAELQILSGIEDFVIYTTPERMERQCDFIYAWDKERLFELADFRGKVILDVGSGSGRLAFAAAERALEVYASEPVSTLREYLRDKITREGIRNVRVVDGMARSIPYPDNSFDIVMSGHVVGEDYNAELAELTRVVKPGGWILDCPGENPNRRGNDGELKKRGWEEFYYRSVLGGDVYRYRKQIFF